MCLTEFNKLNSFSKYCTNKFTVYVIITTHSNGWFKGLITNAAHIIHTINFLYLYFQSSAVKEKSDYREALQQQQQ